MLEAETRLHALGWLFWARDYSKTGRISNLRLHFHLGGGRASFARQRRTPCARLFQARGNVRSVPIRGIPIAAGRPANSRESSLPDAGRQRRAASAQAF